jgi:hypothetical protein
MRVRKIHAVLAVSVALVLVARSIEGRRRAQRGFPAVPGGEVPSEGDVGSLTAEPGTTGDPAVPVHGELSADDEPAPTARDAESDAGSAGKRRLRRGPLAVAVVVVVVIAVLAGTVVAVAAGATSTRSSWHHSAPSSLHH